MPDTKIMRVNSLACFYGMFSPEDLGNENSTPFLEPLRLLGVTERAK